MKVTAKKVEITVGGKKIAGATDANLSLTTVFATSQTKEDEGEVSIPEKVDWTLNSSSLIGEEDADHVDITALENAAKFGTKLQVKFSIGTMAAYQGTAMITSYSEAAPTEGRPTCSATLKGVSHLTKV